jgi:hypothetical protein
MHRVGLQYLPTELLTQIVKYTTLRDLTTLINLEDRLFNAKISTLSLSLKIKNLDDLNYKLCQVLKISSIAVIDQCICTCRRQCVHVKPEAIDTKSEVVSDGDWAKIGAKKKRFGIVPIRFLPSSLTSLSISYCDDNILPLLTSLVKLEISQKHNELLHFTHKLPRSLKTLILNTWTFITPQAIEQLPQLEFFTLSILNKKKYIHHNEFIAKLPESLISFSLKTPYIKTHFIPHLPRNLRNLSIESKDISIIYWDKWPDNLETLAITSNKPKLAFFYDLPKSLSITCNLEYECREST